MRALKLKFSAIAVVCLFVYNYICVMNENFAHLLNLIGQHHQTLEKRDRTRYNVTSTLLLVDSAIIALVAGRSFEPPSNRYSCVLYISLALCVLSLLLALICLYMLLRSDTKDECTMREVAINAARKIREQVPLTIDDLIISLHTPSDRAQRWLARLYSLSFATFGCGCATLALYALLS